MEDYVESFRCLQYMGNGQHFIYENVNKFSICCMEVNIQELIHSISYSSLHSRVQMKALI